MGMVRHAEVTNFRSVSQSVSQHKSYLVCESSAGCVKKYGSCLFNCRGPVIMIFFFLVVITIPRASKTNDGYRIYDKHHYCLYCGKSFQKIARHIRTCHKDEEAVKEAVACTDKKDNKRKWDYLRFKGDYHHNIKIMRTGGELVVWRRPNQNAVVQISEYIPCEFCLAFITKSEIWRHSKSCSLKEEGK